LDHQSDESFEENQEATGGEEVDARSESGEEEEIIILLVNLYYKVQAQSRDATGP
jgi:hypothetical protein